MATMLKQNKAKQSRIDLFAHYTCAAWCYCWSAACTLCCWCCCCYYYYFFLFHMSCEGRFSIQTGSKCWAYVEREKYKRHHAQDIHENGTALTLTQNIFALFRLVWRERCCLVCNIAPDRTLFLLVHNIICVEKNAIVKYGFVVVIWNLF